MIAVPSCPFNNRPLHFQTLTPRISLTAITSITMGISGGWAMAASVVSSRDVLSSSLVSFSSLALAALFSSSSPSDASLSSLLDSWCLDSATLTATARQTAASLRSSWRTPASRVYLATEKQLDYITSVNHF